MNNHIVYEYKALLKNNLPVLKEVASYETHKTTYINSTQNVVDLLNELFFMEELGEEYMYLLALNTKGLPLGIFEVSHGNVNSCLVSGREIFLRLLLVGAVTFILIHNHPSGIPDPSSDDTRVAKAMSESGKMMNITMSDFIIVGKDTYCSFREAGLL